MLRASLLLVVLVVATACAGPSAQPGHAGPSAAVPTSLLADGSVPWADLPITAEDLNGPPPTPRSPSPGSRPCRADQLTGTLSGWLHPSGGDEAPRDKDAAVGKLIGEVDIQNVSDVECTLQGETPTTMLAGDREVPMRYVHGINEEARARVVAVPPGGHARLRLDWSGPFCQSIDGPMQLAIELPHGGGTLRAPITVEDRPTCTQGEAINPNAQATLYASGFTEPAAVSAPAASPLDQLTVAVVGPASASAGSQVRFRVTLGNPTTGPLALNPCPGYMIERFSLGDETNEAVNTSQLYRLNCLPLNQIPAGDAAVFEMVTTVPPSMRQGRELTVTWKLYLPHYAQRGEQFGIFTLSVT